MTMTAAHLDAVRNARFLAIAALAIGDDKTHKTREKHQRIATLLSEVCDFIESATVCPLCDGTGYKDHAGFAMDACNHEGAA